MMIGLELEDPPVYIRGQRLEARGWRREAGGERLELKGWRPEAGVQRLEVQIRRGDVRTNRRMDK